MRIIAGKYKGRPLSTVHNLSIRPTTDRAKQTIFDMLSNRIEFSGARVLDLFAGSGSLGLEALSRGAAFVVFVEKARSSLDVLEKNIRYLDCADQCRVHQADVFWYLKNTQQAFDLIFVDPPYKLETIGTLPNAIYNSKVVHPETYIVMEHSKESVIDLDEQKFDIIKKLFGQTVAIILKVRTTS